MGVGRAAGGARVTKGVTENLKTPTCFSED